MPGFGFFYTPAKQDRNSLPKKFRGYKGKVIVIIFLNLVYPIQFAPKTLYERGALYQTSELSSYLEVTEVSKIKRGINGHQIGNSLWIFIGILFFSLTKSLVYSTGKVFFDEGVYVGIARYFSSGGSNGFFEYVRPLLLPFILAPLQYSPADPLVSGRILSFLLTICCILLVYRISRAHFGEHSARWSLLLFAASSSVIFFGGNILTDVLVFTLVLASASFAWREKWFFAGCVLGVSFLLKFPALILCFPIMLLIVFRYFRDKHRYIKKLLIVSISFGAGLILCVMPYFIFNFFYYSGPLFERIFFPLMDASSILQNDTWIYEKASLWKYSLFLLIIELPVVISFIYLWICSLRTEKQEKKPILLFFTLCAASFILYFSMCVARLDYRYMLSVIPFLAVIGGYGLSRIIKPLKAVILILAAPLIVVCVFLVVGVAKTTVSISTGRDLVITNAGQALLKINGKAELYPGPNFGHLYSQWYMNSSAEWLIISLEGYPCQKDDIFCKEELQLQVSRLLTANQIVSCGKLYGEDVIILAKHPQATITREDCIKNIRGGSYPNISAHPYVRLHAAVITIEGQLQNLEGLKEVTGELSEQKISSVLVIAASNISLDCISRQFIAELPDNVELGVLPKEGINTADFIMGFKKQTNKTISIIASPSDDWIKSSQEFPQTIKSCVRGAWDQTIMKIPCKKIDLYTIKDWNTLSLNGSGGLYSLYASFDALSNTDYEVGVDIPVAALYRDNMDEILKLIGYIGEGRKDVQD